LDLTFEENLEKLTYPTQGENSTQKPEEIFNG
jgi:hypothetical protein